MWDQLVAGSDELAEELGLPDLARRSILDGIDDWVGEGAQLEAGDVARIGFLIARLLVEEHGGGLTRIASPGHPLDGEWAITGFNKRLRPDYHVPFLVSAARIALDRSLTAKDWYRQVLEEGQA
jgi:hypothetical protein